MQHNMFLRFHKKLFCWMHEWMHLGIEDLRQIEAKTKAELDESINQLEMETKSSPVGRSRMFVDSVTPISPYTEVVL